MLSYNLQVAINKTPAGLLSHMDRTFKQGFFSFSVLPASCYHQSVSSESENISEEFSSPTSHRIERTVCVKICMNNWGHWRELILVKLGVFEKENNWLTAKKCVFQ